MIRAHRVLRRRLRRLPHRPTTRTSRASSSTSTPTGTPWTTSPPTAGPSIEDGHLRCPVCAARHLCGSLDHLWDVWRVCECRGAIPAHHANGCGLVRTCAQCGAIDIATLAHLPTTGHHHRRGR